MSGAGPARVAGPAACVGDGGVEETERLRPRRGSSEPQARDDDTGGRERNRGLPYVLVARSGRFGSFFGECDVDHSLRRA